MAEPTSSEDMTDSDIEAWFETHQVSAAKRDVIRREVAMSRELRALCLAAADRAKAGASISMDDLTREMMAVADAHGCDMGIPMPNLEMDHAFVTAKRTPLGAVLQYHTQEHETELSQWVAERGGAVRNSWQVLGDGTVVVIGLPNGQSRHVHQTHAGSKLRKLMDTAMLRSSIPNQSPEAELKAMESLKGKLTRPQWASYVLNGLFPERSAKSDLHYIFRKGLPTLVVSYHGDQHEGGAIIAALCLHPFGYYQYTHCGSMVPTDEVIAHLLLMRADEHAFWKKSGQWHVTDTRSGL